MVSVTALTRTVQRGPATSPIAGPRLASTTALTTLFSVGATLLPPCRGAHGLHKVRLVLRSISTGASLVHAALILPIASF